VVEERTFVRAGKVGVGDAMFRRGVGWWGSIVKRRLRAPHSILILHDGTTDGDSGPHEFWCNGCAVEVVRYIYLVGGEGHYGAVERFVGFSLEPRG
jgi:hypothetical protein